MLFLRERFCMFFPGGQPNLLPCFGFKWIEVGNQLFASQEMGAMNLEVTLFSTLFYL